MEPVLVRLGEIRRRARNLFALYGIGMTVIAVCLAAAVSFALDWAIRELPFPVRLVILALCVVAVEYVAFQYLVYPLRRQISDDDIAICVERNFPELKDKLISSVQLSRGGDGHIELHSPALVKKLIQETMAQVGGMRFNTILVPAVPAWTFAGGVGLVVLSLAYAAFYPKNMLTWLRRFYDPDARWPKQTTLLVDLKDETLMAKGDTFRCAVRVEGKVPARVVMEASFESGAVVKERLDKGQDDDEFVAIVPRVQESFLIRFEGGDDCTNDFKVTVLTPPHIERVRVSYSYPRYMGLTDTNPAMPVEGGNVKAPIGTSVTVFGTSNIALESGRVFLGRRDQEQLVPTSLGVDPEKGARHRLTATFEVASDGEYFFQLVGDNRLVCTDPVRYTVRAMLDNGPMLKVIEPNADKLVTPEAVLRIRAQTTDDYGVALIFMQYAVLAGDTKIEKRVDFDTSHNDAKYGEKAINSEFAFEMPVVGVKPGDMVSYFLEAADNRDKPAPNVTRSRAFSLAVVSRDQLQRLTEERQQRVRGELRRLIEVQTSERTGTGRYDKLLSQKEELEQSERQMLHGSATAQRQIGQRLERLAREVGEIVADIATNKLWDISVQERLSGMQEEMKAIAGTPCTEAANMLVQAANSIKQQERAESIAAAGSKQDEIIAALKELYGQMEEWEDYADIVRQVRELLDKHRHVMRAIEGGEDEERK
jgi:hypothetical protein